MPRKPLDALSDNAKELVRQRLAGLAAEPAYEPPDADTIDGARSGLAPLSLDQRRLWFLCELRPGRVDYNVAAAWRIRGPLRVSDLDAALVNLVTGHEALRSVVFVEDGEPFQRVLPAPVTVLEQLDLSDAPDPTEAAVRFAYDQSAAPFDLGKGPLYRFSLARLGDDEHVLSMVVHHLAIDRDSLEIILEEVAAGYQTGTSSESTLRKRYADYAREQWSIPRGTASPHWTYWRDQLDGVSVLLELPTDRRRPRTMLSGDAGEVRVEVDVITAGGVRALAEQAATTPFVVCLAAFDALLHRYTGSTSFTVGCPFSARNRRELERVVGFFARSLPLVSRPTRDMTFRSLVQQTRVAMLEAHEHQEIPLEDIVALAHPPRDTSYNPLFQVWFDYFEAVPEGVVWPAPLRVQPFECGDSRTRFDLEVQVTRSRTGLRIRAFYATELFDNETAREFIDHYRRLLAGAVASPETTLSRLPLLGEDEMRTIVTGWATSERRAGP